jgi:hypothetical protein
MELGRILYPFTTNCLASRYEPTSQRMWLGGVARTALTGLQRMIRILNRIALHFCQRLLQFQRVDDRERAKEEPNYWRSRSMAHGVGL